MQSLHVLPCTSSYCCRGDDQSDGGGCGFCYGLYPADAYTYLLPCAVAVAPIGCNQYTSLLDALRTNRPTRGTHGDSPNRSGVACAGIHASLRTKASATEEADLLALALIAYLHPREGSGLCR